MEEYRALGDWGDVKRGGWGKRGEEASHKKEDGPRGENV